jgi:hypothetical protein
MAKTLLEVAKRLGELTAIKAPRSRRGSNGKPAGNLKRTLKEVNTGRNVLSGLNSSRAEKQITEDLKSGTYTFEFNIDVAPPGAEYGKYWNDPNVSEQVENQKTGNKDKINFADQAVESAEFQSILNEYMETLTDKIADGILKAIDRELK